MVEINAERLLGDMRRIADFGRYKTGVHRPTFSPQDVTARAWLAERMREAGLDAVVDGVGNVLGKSRSDGSALLVGSHAESECFAGWLDGILGVLYGVELARAFRDDPACRDLAVDVGAWADEECHFLQFLGSRSFVGDLDERELDTAVNKDDGTPLREAIRAAGYEGRPRLAIDASRCIGYLEAHIEQGDYLNSSGLRLGIVTSIVGLYQYKITFFGQQNHAGTTRMANRKDAGLALVDFAGKLDRAFRSVNGKRSVWTTGQIRLHPGAASIIPGRAEMEFQFRDDDPGQLAIFERTLAELVAAADGNPCRSELEVVYKAAPKLMAPRFQSALEDAAERHAPGAYVPMPSAAAHDAQIFANHMPAGMLFVPSIGGISHHYEENTTDADIALGCQVFATAAEMILRTARE